MSARLAILLVLLGTASPAAAQEQTLRVMTYNIHAGVGGLEQIADVIRDAAPDIVGLQEVDVYWSARSGFADLAGELAAALGMDMRFGHIYDLPSDTTGRPPRRYGLAILSRYPITSFRNHLLPRSSSIAREPEPLPRPGFLEAHIDVNGTAVRFFNTHLDYRANPRVRTMQVAETLTLIGELDQPTLLVGDLNAQPQDGELQPLFARMRDAWSGQTDAGLTFRADSLVKRIDYVLHSAHFTPRAARVVTSDASDHLAVVADLTLHGAHAQARDTSAVVALHRIFDDAWAEDLRANPLFASQVGVRDYDALLPDVSEAAEQQRLAELRRRLARLDAIDYAALPRSEQINLDIFRRLTETAAREIEMRAYLMPFTTFVPFYSSLPDMGEWLPLDDVASYEDYLARLNAVRAHMESYIALMRAGLREGITIPRVVLDGVVADLDAQLVADATQSRFYLPFTGLPPSIPSAERARLQQAGADAVRNSVLAGYRLFRDFMADEYIPAARTSIGASELPNGRAFYEHRVKMYTTLDVTPDEVHERGLSEVQRIRAEMQEVIDQTGFDGTFAEFLNFLRTDPQFYATTAEELLEKNAVVLKRMDGQLPRLFGTLPRTPYGIRPIPDYMAPKMTTAYYRPPAGDGSTAGYYYINTYDLKSRPLYEVQALSFHEAVPGHHLQNAIAMELGDVPQFRRFAGFTAFGEGWGLYAERLGLEVGFYQDPYANFGRLSYEMWRALRLAVDTGIHWKGWSRQQAIDFMAENSALALHNITAEVDRYISWPGQALGYKMGELAIRDLRARAEVALGDAFDVRAFHDVVLGSGEVPLDVLEANVERWIARQGSVR